MSLNIWLPPDNTYKVMEGCETGMGQSKMQHKLPNPTSDESAIFVRTLARQQDQ
jgi:hypothetical protein